MRHARRRRAPTTAPRTRGTAPKRIRSTTAPETSAVVMMQNVAWKAKKTQVRDRRALARREGDVVQERVVEAADDCRRRRRTRASSRRSAQVISRDRDRADAHHERVERVLGAHEARVEEPERRRHHQHERGRGEHPGGVAAVDLRRLGDRQDSSISFATGVTRQVVGLAGADPHHALERDDEDLAVADLAGARALAERVDRRLHERVGDRDLEAHLLRRAPSGPSCRGRSRPGRARRRDPARGSSRTRAPRPGRAPRVRRLPSPVGRCRSRASRCRSSCKRWEERQG